MATGPKVLLFVVYESGEVPVELPLDATVADLNQEAVKLLSTRGHIEFQDERLDDRATLADSGLGMQARVNFVRLTEEEEAKLGEQLYEAAKRGDVHKAKEAIEGGANPNWRYKANFNDTPLHEAAAKGHGECVELLCKLGADVNAKAGLVPGTPLHRAAFFFRVEAVDVLCNFHADPNIRDSAGRTPLEVVEKRWHNPNSDNIRRILEPIMRRNL